MKTLFLTIALLGAAVVARAQNTAQDTAPAAAPNYTLTVDIEQLKPGTVFVSLQDPTEKAVQRQAVAVTEGAVKVVFRNLAPGQYAVRYFVDENNNRTFDKGMFGIPKEGWGCSNDVSASFGPPKFEAMLFPVATDKTIVVHTR